VRDRADAPRLRVLDAVADAELLERAQHVRDDLAGFGRYSGFKRVRAQWALDNCVRLP